MQKSFGNVAEASAGSELPQPASLGQSPDEHWPFYDQDEIDAAVSVLRSGRVNQWTGPEVFEFQDVSEFFVKARGPDYAAVLNI